jgi:hypothetical protein
MKNFLLFSITLFFFSCHDYRHDFDSITFGKGGGFTGKYDEYRIDNSGNVYKIDRKASKDIFVKLLPGKQCKEIFKTVSASGISKLKINSPYNMTSYIMLTTKSDTMRLVWGDPKKQPDKKVDETFEMLMNVIK